MAQNIVDTSPLSLRSSGLKSHKALPTSKRLSQECNEPTDPAMAYAPQSIMPYSNKCLAVDEKPLQLVHRNSILLPPTPPSPQILPLKRPLEKVDGNNEISPVDSTSQSLQTPPPVFEPLTPDTTPPRRPARMHTIARKPLQRQARPASESYQAPPSQIQPGTSLSHEHEKLTYNPWSDKPTNVPRAVSQQLPNIEPVSADLNEQIAKSMRSSLLRGPPMRATQPQQPIVPKPRRTALPDFTEADFAEAMLKRFPRLSFPTDLTMASTVVEAAILMPTEASPIGRELRHKRKNASLRDSGISMSGLTPASSRQVSQSSMEKKSENSSPLEDSPVLKTGNPFKDDSTANHAVPETQFAGLGLGIKPPAAPRISPQDLRVSIPKHVSIIENTDTNWRSSSEDTRQPPLHAISALDNVTLTPMFTNRLSALSNAMNPLLLTPFSGASVMSSPGLHQIRDAKQMEVFSHTNSSVQMVTHNRRLSRQHDNENLRASAFDFIEPPFVSLVSPVSFTFPTSTPKAANDNANDNSDDAISRISSPSSLSDIPIRTSTSRQRLNATSLWPARMPASAETFVTAHSYLPEFAPRLTTPVPLSLRASPALTRQPTLFVGNSLGIPQKRVILGPMALVRKLSKRRGRAGRKPEKVREVDSNDAIEANQSALVALQNRSRFSADSGRVGRFWRVLARGARRVGVGRLVRSWRGRKRGY